MRISVLSERTGVSVATLKYYLREGLVPPGTPTGRTQASYDEGHVERVRLVRALVGSAGLSIAAARRVVALLDEPPDERVMLLGLAQLALLADEAVEPVAAEANAEWHAKARAFLDARGWCAYEHNEPMVERLATQLANAAAAGVPLSEERLAGYADAARELAVVDVASVPSEPAGAVHQVVVGTIVTDPIVLTLRRIAQAEVSGAQ